MTQKILGPEGSRRRRRFWLVPMVAALFAVVFYVAGAQAVHDTGIFQLDRNAVTTVDGGTVPATHDWDQVCKAATATSATPLCTSPDPGSAGTTVVTFDTDPTGQSVFTGAQSGGSSKDFDFISGWRWKAGTVPDKDEILHGFAARYSATPDTTAPTLCPSGGKLTCELIFFGADRFDASGDSQIGFWFYQNRITCNPPAGSTDCNSTDSAAHTFTGEHKDGDILVLSDFTQGGGTPNIKIFQWNAANDPTIPGGGTGKCAGNPKTCDTLELLGGGDNPADCIGPPVVGTGDGFCATVNNATATSPWPFTNKDGGTSFAAGEFYEGGINLSLLPGGIASECFASFSVETRSSATVDSILKDFVLGNFGNCQASMTTQQSDTDASVSPGTPVTDLATVTGNQPTKTPSGNVTFFMCTTAAGSTTPCDGTTGNVGTQVGSPVALSGSNGVATATSAAVNTAASPLAPGRYCFRAEWPGDTNYTTPLKEFSNATECFTVVQSSTTTVTKPQSGGVDISGDVVPGTSVTDHAVVTGATGFGNPTGTVDFFICNPTQVTGTAGNEVCAAPNGTAVSGNPVTVTPIAGSSPPKTEATSGAVTANAVGVWCFRAAYTPDTTNYTGSGDATHGECFTVVNKPTTTKTTPQVAGDPNVDISAPVAVNTSVVDHAVITGVAGFGTPTGTVDFFICNPTQVTGTAGNEVCAAPNGTAVTGNPKTAVAIAGSDPPKSQATSGAVTANVVGVWCFRAAYTSNTINYTDSGDATHGECFSVRDSSSLTSKQNWLPNDSATVSATGGTALNGTVTFELYPTADCTGTKVAGQTYTETLTNATTLVDRTKKTSNTTFTVDATGATHWSWKVTFASTDPNVTSPASPTCEKSDLTITN